MSGKLKEVKNRIGSVKSTQQITKAMKLVAASKFKRATDAIVQMRPYSTKLSEILRNIVTATEGDVKIDLAEERSEIQNLLLVVITSDKGLCGGFNSNVIKKAKEVLKDYPNLYKAGKITMMNVGKKGNDPFKRDEYLKFNLEYIDLFKGLNFEKSVEATEFLLDEYQTGIYDKVIVCYAEFKNAVTQEFKKVNFLPIEKIDSGSETKETAVDYIFEPDKNQLIQELAPKILKTQFYKYLLDSHASEHGARMTAMDNATTNAKEMLNDLQIAYNKARQAAITTELTEIVSGAAALQGN